MGSIQKRTTIKTMIPTFLLIGCGNFGKCHLRILQNLHAQKQIILKGVVVASKKSADAIKKQYNVPTFSSFDVSLLSDVTAVAITTPASTHYSLVKQCIPHAHVLVEKPLALEEKELQELSQISRQNKKILMAGHIFRFNKAVQEFKKIVQKNKHALYTIEGHFIGQGKPSPDCGVLPTFLHLFDILDFILEKQPTSVYAVGKKVSLKNKYEDYVTTTLSYPSFQAHLSHGWIGAQKQRTLLFKFLTMDIFCDLLTQNITIFKQGKEKIIQIVHPEPLLWEYETFFQAISKPRMPYPDAALAQRIQKTIFSAEQSLQTKKVINL